MAIIEATEYPVRALLERKLTIPGYQRPYKWQDRHVRQLLEDLDRHQHKQKYRLGTVVLHGAKGAQSFDIVDGQQRLLTLTLICHMLNSASSPPRNACHPSLLTTVFSNPVTQQNIGLNATVIDDHLRPLSVEAKQRFQDFLLDRCELVCVQLEELNEAFQFFDSQNARGKALEPEDLLKAYHLREMREDSDEARQECVSRWEKQVRPVDKNLSLSNIVGKVLFPIRRWCRDESGLYFGRQHLNIFKGLSLQNQSYRYASSITAAHLAVERYNADPMRKWDKQRMEHPFTADQALLNGRLFFKFIEHYTRLYEALFVRPKEELDSLLHVLDTYEGHYRPGDKYVRNLFECTLLHYHDRFGDLELERAAELCFLWSYAIRLQQKRVVQASIDNAALNEKGLFQAIGRAMHPHEVLAYRLPREITVTAGQVDGLVTRFKQNKIETKS